jgi:proline iminopeptidase
MRPVSYTQLRAHETGRYFPEEWDRFRAGVPEGERDGDLVAAYDRLLNGDAELAVRLQAARDWVAWEDAILSLEEGYVRPTRAGRTSGSWSASPAW